MGSINAENIKLKYGAPTEIFPKSSELLISGYNVPSNIANVVIVKNKLLSNNANSFEDTEYCFLKTNICDFKKYKVKEEPIINVKNNRIYKPLSGSFAKAWTETKIPDLTRNVPSKLNENVNIDRRILQLMKIPLFSETIKECNNAVMASQGIKDAFSTGSQNHQPPQPNSW